MAVDYKQYNYPNTPFAGESIAVAGCGPTSCSDILEIDPTITAKWIDDNNWSYPGQGTKYAGINACLTHFGADGKMIAQYMDKVMTSKYFDEWKKAIQSGYEGILLMHNCINNYWTNGGHYIAIVAYDKNKGYMVYDPASVTRTGWHPFSDFAGNISALYTSNRRWDNGKIVEDSWWGPATTKLAQKVFKTTVDGIISNQNRDMQKFLPNCQKQSWEFVAPTKLKNGSQLIKAIQKMLGIPADGFFGNQTIRALQKFLGVTVDGYFGGKSVLAWQKWLNKQ